MVKRAGTLAGLAVVGLVLSWSCEPAEETGAAARGCDHWAAQVVSAEGLVEVRRGSTDAWTPAILDERYCAGDVVRLRAYSRAALLLPNETLLRLDQNTTVTLSRIGAQEESWLDVLTGVIHAISRVSRTLRVLTPFVNAAVEGTELVVRVEPSRATVTVLEGRVLASNEWGSTTVSSGQSAVAATGQAPALRIELRPRDAVRWALYYPPLPTPEPGELAGLGAGERAALDRALELQRQRQTRAALAALPLTPSLRRFPALLVLRARLLLAVGAVQEANADLEEALRARPDDGPARALQAIVALAQNRGEEALRLAREAVAASPDSPAAWLALSYAEQASFRLEEALGSAEEATERGPREALAWTRVSELRLSLGELDRALAAAQQAVEHDPGLSQTQTVLGFAYLTQTKIGEARSRFRAAIEADPADPLPRLGLGLAQIRDGRLADGRREIEIAASLDPDDALVRSYLGKAYYDERRSSRARTQYTLAQSLDPLDPTAFFYDAILDQTSNRPVEALHKLQRSIALNANRLVYRSRLLLDQDLAARSASLARIYTDLGFDQLALVAGWESVNTDPGTFSAHRFLSDTYATLPRHEIARVSELLQSQLLQPLNVTPIQPQQTTTNPAILEIAGPSALSFNEFNPLFLRNRIALQAGGLVGGNSTWGDDLINSAVHGRFSYSLGQSHYESDGFRDNNDQREDLYDLFVQAAPSYGTSVQAELRSTRLREGDLALRFDPENFSPFARTKLDEDVARFGLHQRLSPRSEVLVSIVHSDLEERFSDLVPGIPPIPDFAARQKNDFDTNGAELGHLFRSRWLHTVGGVGAVHSDARLTETVQVGPIPIPPTITHEDIRHNNAYLYPSARIWDRALLTLGTSFDDFEDALTSQRQLNPKLGLSWSPASSTSLRAAAFRVLTRTLVADQTIEPTQVAGFNQFFDDPAGSSAWRYGLGIDHTLTPSAYLGGEYSWRQLDVPYRFVCTEPDGCPSATKSQRWADWDERFGRAYFYWAPQPWLAATLEYQYEWVDRADASRPQSGDELVGEERLHFLKTHRVPLGLRVFLPSGLFAGVRGTYLRQKGAFQDPSIITGEPARGEDQFWVFDAAVGYRLPKRHGVVQVGVRNLFDQRFHHQDTDPANPRIYPERFLFAGFTLAF